jgi:hypothetical protein
VANKKGMISARNYKGGCKRSHNCAYQSYQIQEKKRDEKRVATAEETTTLLSTTAATDNLGLMNDELRIDRIPASRKPPDFFHMSPLEIGKEGLLVGWTAKCSRIGQ